MTPNQKKYYTDPALRSHDLLLEPTEVVDSNPLLPSTDRHQNILAVQHGHLLKATTGDQLVD